MVLDVEMVRLLQAERVIAVVRAARIAEPAGLAEALVSHGVRLIEITLSVADAAAAISAIASTPAVVGAGTVTTAEDAQLVIAHGARFVVTPTGVEDEVSAVCRDANVPMIVGALSPTEVLMASRAGAAAVKLFPARLMGSRYLHELGDVFPELAFVPSGGLEINDAPAYLGAGACAVSLGGALVSPAAAQAGDHEDVARRAKQVSHVVDAFRERVGEWIGRE